MFENTKKVFKGIGKDLVLSGAVVSLAMATTSTINSKLDSDSKFAINLSGGDIGIATKILEREYSKNPLMEYALGYVDTYNSLVNSDINDEALYSWVDNTRDFYLEMNSFDYWDKINPEEFLVDDNEKVLEIFTENHNRLVYTTNAFAPNLVEAMNSVSSLSEIQDKFINNLNTQLFSSFESNDKSVEEFASNLDENGTSLDTTTKLKG